MAEGTSTQTVSGEEETWTPTIPFTQLARNHLDFLKTVYNHPHLQREVVLKNAVRRYEDLWLPLLLNHADRQVEPPIDVHWIWHSHMLSPVDYINDCKRILKVVPPHTLRALNSQEYYSALAEAENLWKELYPGEEFEVDYEKLTSNIKSETAESSEGSDLPDRKCQYDLVAATGRQKAFFYQVSLPHFWDERFLDAAVERYIKFLFLKKANKDLFTVPMYDIDLIWHTHQLHPQVYARDTRSIVGRILPHNDKDQDRRLASKLSVASRKTKAAWTEKYGSLYAINGTCYRGLSHQGLIHKDEGARPSCRTHVVNIQSVTITGCQGSDVISAKICDASGDALLELPKMQAKENTLSWKPDSKIEVTTVGPGHESVFYLYMTDRQGWIKSITATPLAKVVLRAKLPQESGDKNPIEVKAKTGSMTTELQMFVIGAKEAEVPMYIEWGAFTNEPLPESPKETWGPLNIPPSIQIPPSTMCQLATHLVTVCGSVLYSVRVIHMTGIGLSFIHVYNDHHLVATSEIISPFQLPESKQVDSPAKCVTLETDKQERGMLIKNSDGDWGIVKGHRPQDKDKLQSIFLDTELVASLTILSPLSTGTFSLVQSPSWKRVTSSLSGMFANTSRMELFGSRGVTVYVAEGRIDIGEHCTNLPEFLATIFSVWVD